MQVVPELVTKIIEIHDCKVARHGNMLVGKTGSGKTTAWKTLQQALGRLHQEHPANPAFQPVRFCVVHLTTRFHAAMQQTV